MESIPISNSSLWQSLLILLVSVATVAFFSSSEASLISVSKIRIRSLAEQGNGMAKAVERVVQRHERFFATILLTENAFIIFASSTGTALAITFFGEGGESILMATVVMTVLIVIFGEITPKTLAAQRAERFSLLVARPIEIIMALEAPFIALFTIIPRLLTKALGRRMQSGSPFVTEAELKMLISIGEAEGTVELTEKEMLNRIFSFTDRQVKEVMTPRPEIVWLEKGGKPSDFYQVFSQSYHARFPVCEDNPDNVIGILYIKDLLRSQAMGILGQESTLESLVRPAFFVPETKRVGKLFHEMRDGRYQIAIVVDEYGGTAGLVTFKQLIAEIVGQAGDELMTAEKDFVTIDEKTIQMDGGMRIDDANEKLELDFPEGDYDTVAGFLLDCLGHVPKEGEQIRYKDFRLTVAEMKGVKIEKVLVTRG